MTTARPSLALAACLATLGGLAGCHDRTTPPCDPASQTGCEAGLACELVVGGATGCFEPVVVAGAVADLDSGVRLSGARVVALDVDGAPLTSVGTSSDGTPPAAPLGDYALTLPATRTADGAPVARDFTLRADRAGSETFPSGLRTALPISTAAAVRAGGRWTVRTTATELALTPLPSAPPGRITGTVALPPGLGGVLLVAERAGSGAGFSAMPDRNGAFTLFNLPDGTYELRGYARGVGYAPVTVVVAGGVATPASVSMPVASYPANLVSGSVQLVSATSWSETSVLLVVASTFDPARARGAAPPGLKVSGVSSTWGLGGIPDGHYRVLAGFETDYLVRDPSDIGGTAVLEFQVVDGAPLLMDGATSAATLQGFKITGAVRLTTPLRLTDGRCTGLGAALPVDPGALVSGACTTSSPTPSFGWETYPATDLYRVTVVDDRGAIAWQADVEKVANGVAYATPTGTGGVAATLAPAQPLVAGRTYQVKVAATKTTGGGSTLSASEDLLGVFTYAP